MTPPPSLTRRIGANAIGAFAVFAIADALVIAAAFAIGDAPDPSTRADASAECDAPFNPRTGAPACVGAEAMRAMRSPTPIADAASVRPGNESLDSMCGGGSAT